jgi:uncharacterized protein (TIGR00266 family)
MNEEIKGTTMPVLEVTLEPGESVVAESGELGWIAGPLELTTTTGMRGDANITGALKRSFGGGAFFMTQYTATTESGMVAFPTKLPGQIVKAPLGDREYIVRQGGFLAGTLGCEVGTAFHASRLGSGMLGGFGFVLQKLSGTGHAWIELSGEVTEYELAPGDTLRVRPGHVGLLESSVAYELTTVPGIKNKLFGGDGLFLLKLTGPGKVWLQSLTVEDLARVLRPELQEQDSKAQGASAVLDLLR